MTVELPPPAFSGRTSNSSGGRDTSSSVPLALLHSVVAVAIADRRLSRRRKVDGSTPPLLWVRSSSQSRRGRGNDGAADTCSIRASV
ncbi:hypothetical protein PUN28_005404 [Cardiocondyla obscurior]|uniref:Uncharacterized protein n=1 Tax=Cardiocondyla obscurior TaxID=286306 RepID=A0AAW2GFQ6_9HYME